MRTWPAWGFTGGVDGFGSAGTGRTPRPRLSQCGGEWSQIGMEPDWDVIVVGAGLAGLAAATTAAREGARVVVLEAHQPGGRARTVEREGFTLNMGAHALYVGGVGMAVLRSLGIEPAGAPPPLARYQALRAGATHLLPTSPATLIRTDLIGARSKAQLVGVLGRLPRVKTDLLVGTSMAEWVSGLRLRPDAEAVVRALIRIGTYTDDVEGLSADAGVAQLQLAAKGGVRYLHGGWSQLVDSLRTGLDVRTASPVTAVEPVGRIVDVRTGEGTLSASSVVLATGGPAAVRRLLPVDPGWGDLGPPVTAACLDLGVSRVPTPGYILSLDDPVYVNVQSPPARQSPGGQAVVAAIRYGARDAVTDRAQLEDLVAAAGVRADEVVTRRFLADMSVSGSLPRVRNGGLAGRPDVTDTGTAGVVMAGDWVGQPRAPRRRLAGQRPACRSPRRASAFRRRQDGAVTIQPPPDPVDLFERERPRLVGLAYRMLGTVSDAEDVVQTVWFRWDKLVPGEIERPGAWLTTVTTRIALDHLRAARRRRESYVGPWLPEPLVGDPLAGGSDRVGTTGRRNRLSSRSRSASGS